MNEDIVAEHYDGYVLVDFRSRQAKHWFLDKVIPGAQIVNGKLFVPEEMQDIFDFMIFDAELNVTDELK